MHPHTVRAADAIVVRSETSVNSSLLEGSSVRFVGTATIGTDHIATDYLQTKGISFASAPGSNANSVAEYVAAALLVLAERTGAPLAGRTLGVVGVGHVGSKVARAARALGMNLLLCDPPLARATGDASFRPLDELMSADIVTLHVPLTKEGPDPTWHMFDERRLRQMRRGAVLINTSRGAVSATAALNAVLADGMLSAAILDVWENEPAINTELLTRVLLGTPHIAGYSLDGKVNAVRMIAEALFSHTGANPHAFPPWQLPPPPVDRIILPAAIPGVESALRSVVQQCYDIARDDRRLRGIDAVPGELRGKYFRQLRTEYPLRREFPATTVVLPPDARSLAATLQLLGFRVECPGNHHA